MNLGNIIAVLFCTFHALIVFNNAFGSNIGAKNFFTFFFKITQLKLDVFRMA